MAKNKYDLITVDTSTKNPSRHHPWYEERLKLKFMKTINHSASLDGAKWTFLPRDMDDLRTGVPLKCTRLVKKGQVNTVPIIKNPLELLNKTTRSSGKSSNSPGTSNSGKRTLYNKMGPRRQLQQERIDSVESGLLRHPLVLYPHLEESVTPEMFEDIIEILDPAAVEVLSGNESTHTKKDSTLGDNQIEQSEEILTRGTSLMDDTPYDRNPRLAIYKFPLIKTDAEKEREMDLIASQQVISAKQQSKVKEVTRDLVEWGAQLGGSNDSVNIDENAIGSLFGGEYESKPILMAPIQVIDLSNIPPEIYFHNQSTNVPFPPSRGSVFRSLHYCGYQRIEGSNRLFSEDSDEKPCVVKSRYGAWYLPIKLWKLQPSDQPLTDPKFEPAKVECEYTKKKLEMDEKISYLHGARSFKEYILANKRGLKMPSFLHSVNTNPLPSLYKRRFT